MHTKTISLARTSLFIVYFWFGLLKVLNLSPAEQLVSDLFQKTLAWLLPFSVFYLLFALFECALGLLFLWRGKEKWALVLTLLHIFTTAMPLVLLPDQTWSGVFVPSLTGQYILKNVLIVAMAWILYEQTRPQQSRSGGQTDGNQREQ